MMTYGLMIFAAAFFVVGMFRIVEFEAAGIPKSQRLILIPMHLLGTLGFCAATVLLAIDPAGHFKTWSSWLFYGSIVILFPLHIYVGLKRRMRMSK